jgi:hypothetical protein
MHPHRRLSAGLRALAVGLFLQVRAILRVCCDLLRSRSRVTRRPASDQGVSTCRSRWEPDGELWRPDGFLQARQPDLRRWESNDRNGATADPEGKRAGRHSVSRAFPRCPRLSCGAP